MRLVVDMNVLFSFFKRESTTRQLITSFEVFELYTPSLCIKELIKHKGEICLKSRISEGEFDEVLEHLNLFVEVVEEEKFKDFSSKAADILSSHVKDVPYTALCFWFKSSELSVGLWSKERRLKALEKYGIKVYTTEELLKLFRLI
ncbi:MAG: hypothetical protein JW778_04800 [Candidatus Altiarchaeota archaeon]|nr:hypothetical protein [Candidatus Altiarchaeota archaeon]